MINETNEKVYLRQLGILNPLSIPPVTLLGAGATGSGIGIILAKLGCNNITIWDGDVVETHNMPNQYFQNKYMGKNKAVALAKEMVSYMPTEIFPNVKPIGEFYTEDDKVDTRIAFLCVDGFKNQDMVFRSMLSQKVDWVINTRMGAEYYEVLAIDMNDETEVEKILDGFRLKPNPLPCTARSVIYNVMGVSSLAVSIFKKIINHEDFPRKVAVDLQFYSPTMVKWDGV
jgi:hypothetical protein